MKYFDRLEKLNSSENTVWNSIDKPMRRLIFEMNRCGMITKFCCFGIPYGEDDEPKSHANDCYVHFYFTELGIKNFQEVYNSYGGEFFKYYNFFPFGDIYCLKIKNTIPDYYEETNVGISIHDYEQYVITIHMLTYFLQDLPGNDIVKIIDGNSLYSDIEFWQIDPKPDFEINSQEFYNKYGRLKDVRPQLKNFYKQNNIVFPKFDFNKEKKDE